MIIKFSNYSYEYRIFALCKDDSSKNYFINKGLNYLCYDNEYAVLYPENIKITITSDEREKLDSCVCYDVFEIDSNGNAYKYYNNCSLDNAILVTNQCNSNCIMCPTPELIRRRKNYYNAESLINIVQYFPTDCSHITITGGEPFMIGEDIFKLFSFLKNNLSNTQYLLLTNGRIFCNLKYVRLFCENKPSNICLGIPLHGYNSDTHDYITQARNSFRQTVNGIENLLAYNVQIELRIVVSKLNCDYLSDIAKLIVSKMNGVACVKIIGLEMTGNAAKNKDQVWIDYPTAFQKAKKCIDLLIENGIDVGIYNFPLCSVDKSYWNICEKSISDYKVRFADECNKCAVKDACGGMFAGTIRLSKNEIKPVVYE